MHATTFRSLAAAYRPPYIPTSIAFSFDRLPPHPGFFAICSTGPRSSDAVVDRAIQTERAPSLEKKSCASPQTSTRAWWIAMPPSRKRKGTTLSLAKPCSALLGRHLTLDPALERPLAKLSAARVLSAPKRSGAAVIEYLVAECPELKPAKRTQNAMRFSIAIQVSTRASIRARLFPRTFALSRPIHRVQRSGRSVWGYTREVRYEHPKWGGFHPAGRFPIASRAGSHPSNPRRLRLPDPAASI